MADGRWQTTATGSLTATYGYMETRLYKPTERHKERKIPQLADSFEMLGEGRRGLKETRASCNRGHLSAAVKDVLTSFCVNECHVNTFYLNSGSKVIFKILRSAKAAKTSGLQMINNIY